MGAGRGVRGGGVSGPATRGGGGREKARPQFTGPHLGSSLGPARSLCVGFNLRPQGDVGGGNRGGGGGDEATDTGLAYAPVSQAHGHHHTVQCFALLHCIVDQFCTTSAGF